MGDVPVKDTSNFDRFGCAGTLPNKLTGIGLEVLESAEAFRWVITQLQRIQEDRHLTPLECDNRVQILRDLMLETVVHLASYPPTKQKRLLAILNGHEYQQVIAAGHIADQLLSAKAVLPQVLETIRSFVFRVFAVGRMKVPRMELKLLSSQAMRICTRVFHRATAAL